LNNFKSKILDLTNDIQKLVDAEFAKVNYKPIPGSNLDQLNLLEGSKVIEEYIKYNEFGLAVDHLGYMIGEINIELSTSEYNKWMELINRFNINIGVYQFKVKSN